jgi:hypothetical protein
VLCQISLRRPVALLEGISAFANEHEVIVNSYQWFQIETVRWDAQCSRWILPLRQFDGRPCDIDDAASWLPPAQAT